MKQRTKLLASLAVALVLGMSIVPAWSYFTATTEANGGLEVTVTPSTDIHEYMNGTEKQVVITNDANATAAVWVRLGVYTSMNADSGSLTGTNWLAADGTDWTGRDGYGWFQYSEILQPGDSTEKFLVDVKEYLKAMEKPEVGVNFNVVVVYESTPVQYDEDGNALAPDWSIKANAGSSSSEGGN